MSELERGKQNELGRGRPSLHSRGAFVKFGYFRTLHGLVRDHSLALTEASAAVTYMKSNPNFLS